VVGVALLRVDPEHPIDSLKASDWASPVPNGCSYRSIAVSNPRAGLLG